MELPDGQNEIFAHAKEWQEYLHQFIEDNKIRIHKVASENLRRKVKPTLTEDEQQLLHICVTTLLEKVTPDEYSVRITENEELFANICRCIGMLVQMPQNEAHPDKKLPDTSFSTLTKLMFSAFQISHELPKLELSVLKCLNNIFFSFKDLQDSFIAENEGENISILFTAFTKINASSFPVYYMICLVLCAKYKEASEPLFELARGTILKICALTNEIITPGTPISAEKLKFKSDNHYTLENGLKLVYGIAATNESIISKLEETYKGDMTEEEGLEAMANLSVIGENVPLLDRLGFVLIRIILAEAGDDKDLGKTLEDLRHQSFCVMMFATKLKTKENFIEILLQKGVVKKVVNFLDDFYQRAPPSQPGVQSTSEQISARVKRNERILPILIILNNFSENHERAKIEMETQLFPFELGEDDYSKMTEEEAKIAKRNRHMIGSTPENSSGGRLIKLMTEFDQNVKRLSGELVWSLCDGDKGKFIDRAGYGNGVHLLAIKGGMLGQMMQQGTKLN